MESHPMVDLSELGLRRGAVESVVETFPKNSHHPGSYIVEFVDEVGEAYAQADITDPAQLVQLHFKQRAA